MPFEEGALPRGGQRRTYTADRHRFYDDLVNICISMACFGAAALAYRGHSGMFDPTDKFELPGAEAGAGVDLLFEPDPLLDAVVRDERPTTLTLQAHARTVWVKQPTREPKRILTPILRAAFVHYYESIEQTIIAVHGKKPGSFPEPLRFGWAVRNACAHDGQVLIKDEGVVVTWYDLTYSLADNGRHEGWYRPSPPLGRSGRPASGPCR
jgi:hypothetical protein